jgi:glycine betaine catabolism A
VTLEQAPRGERTATGGPTTRDAGADPHAHLAAAWEPAPTLAGHEYWSDDVFELERRRLFQGSWYCVGRADEAPEAGSFVVKDVVGESVLIVRDGDRLRAFLNVCRHRGSRLCEGSGALRRIRCPYHAWSYGLDGRLKATPNVSANERLARDSLGLLPVRLDVWEGFVWVSLSDDAPPLDDHLSRWADDDPFSWGRYGVRELVVGACRQYTVAANWKIVIENYNECLHCPAVHPELTKLVPTYRRGEVEDRPGAVGNELATGLTTFTATGRSKLPTLEGLNPADVNRYYGMTLLPNLIVNFNSDLVHTFLLAPSGPAETHITSHYLFRPETVARPGFDPSEFVEFRNLVSSQDWSVCENAQRGMRSRGYAAGGVLPYADRFVRDFNERYHRMLDAYDPAWTGDLA